MLVDRGPHPATPAAAAVVPRRRRQRTRLRGEYVRARTSGGHLHSSVCAERVPSALQLYRQRRPGAVRCICIVTDAPQPIAGRALPRVHVPSPLHAGDARLSATPDLGQRLDVTLAELLPRASPYCRLGPLISARAKATSLQAPPSGSAAAGATLQQNARLRAMTATTSATGGSRARSTTARWQRRSSARPEYGRR